MRLTAGRALATAALFALTACAPDVPDTAPPGGPASPVPAGLDRLYAQRLTWGDCRQFGPDPTSRTALAAPGVQCARLVVPLDYAKPDARDISIGVLRKEAENAADRIGALVFLPGGPGLSGMVSAASLSQNGWTDPLAQRFDLISFDPRGVGSSLPDVRCLSDGEKDEGRAEPPILGSGPEAVAALEEQSKKFADECAAKVGADVLANVGTRDVAKDMDVLRSALGGQKLNYLGFYYGTELGAAYAEAFPGNVPAQAEVRLLQLLEPLKTTPAGRGPGRELSYSDARLAVAQGMSDEQLWPALEQGLWDLTGGDHTGLVQLADVYFGRGQDGGYSTVHDVSTAVRCVDAAQVKDRAVVQGEMRRVRDSAPRTALDECAFWPVPSTGTPRKLAIAGLAEVLVVSATDNPSAPYASGDNLAKALGGFLLPVTAKRHMAVFGDSKCVNDAAAAYLIELKLPAEGMKCS